MRTMEGTGHETSEMECVFSFCGANSRGPITRTCPGAETLRTGSGCHDGRRPGNHTGESHFVGSTRDADGARLHRRHHPKERHSESCNADATGIQSKSPDG